ncbi:TetR/AcrR family transcriptional regulator [Cellulomonas sp.]|uniref:TetR/AcrR family transcriptional regulator n=1 Tax=Cellulomonas sp. TaxID=40001 RepID=UPI00258DB58E|nr:TetR/AcrR family transcriptional regulator [Cellulomonas sp.]MCR6689460.1 TetR/AcrR family transcriptional regulator [Cellulomonas sp.]
MNEALPRRGRPRSPERRRAVLDAAAELALSSGSLPTVDAIATRAGVSRTTLYKWWPSPAAVLVEGLLDRFHASIEFDDDLPVRTALEAQVDALVHLLRDTPAGRLLRQLMAASITDAATATALLDEWLEPRRHAAVHHVERGIASGELRAGTDAALVVDALFAPAYHRLVWGHAPLDDDLAARVCALVWPAIAT